MSAKELREKIEQHQNSIRSQQKALCEIRQNIIEELKPFIKTELKGIVDREVKQDSTHTKELGRENLSLMKQQLLDLLDRSDSLVEEIFSDDTLWIYVNIDADGDRYVYNDYKTAIEKVNDGIKIVLGETGKLFQRFGYSVSKTMYRRKNGPHRDFSLISDNQPQDKLFYQGRVQTPEPLKQLIVEYANKIDPLHQEYIEVSNLQQALSEQEAADLWNEV